MKLRTQILIAGLGCGSVLSACKDPAGKKRYVSPTASLKVEPTKEEWLNDCKGSTEPENLHTMSTLKIELDVPDCDALYAKLRTLTELRLIDKDLLDLRPIRVAQNLTSLIVRDNSITEIGALEAMPNLKVLDLSYNGIKDITPLGGMPNLELIDISTNAVDTLAPLSSLSKLTILKASKNFISSLEPLRQLAQMESLTLAFNNITDLKPLTSMTKLKLLDLAENPNLADISPVQGLKGLETLDVYRILALDLRFLDGFTSLKQLRVGGMQVRFTHLEALAALTSLEKLAIEYYLPPTGTDDYSVLKTLTRLKYLKIEDTDLSDIGFLSSFPQLETLLLNKCSLANFDAVGPLTNLRQLALEGTAFLDFLSPLVKLETLSLIRNQATDFAALKSMSKLKNLRLEAGSSSTSTFDTASISELKGLEVLHFQAPASGLANLSFLSGMKNLKEINLKGTVTDISQLGSLTSLVALDLQGYDGVPDLNQLKTLSNLTTLSFGLATSLPPINLPALAELSKLQYLTMSAIDLTGGCAPLASLKNLTFLWLYKNGLKDLKCLEGLSSLQQLFLLDNKDVSLLDPLATLTSLRYLNINDSNVWELRPLSNLQRLRALDIDRSLINTLKPLTSLRRLQAVSMDGAPAFSNPNLKRENCSLEFTQKGVTTRYCAPGTPYLFNQGRQNRSSFSFDDM